MSYRTAIVVGATGLTGSSLVRQLLEDERFATVRVFARRSLQQEHRKLEEHIIDFEKPDTWQHLVAGDVLFSTLGYTLRQAGGEDRQYRIDYTYQYWFAKAASDNKVPVYVLLSAAMSSPDSRIFYSRMKGELERDVRHLAFHHIHILQPGMLAGDRKENRPMEKIALPLLRFLNRLGIAKNQKPVHVDTVAHAMISVSFRQKEPVAIYPLSDIFRLGAAAGR